MSSWVVPSIAAELWHVSVETILVRMRSGALPSRTEGGFTFVDIAASPAPPPPQDRHTPHKPTPSAGRIAHPPTFRPAGSHERITRNRTVTTADVDHEQLGWRRARSVIGHTRLAPPAR